MKSLSDRFINDDCMNHLHKFKDNHFDLAIVDPEFGIDIGNSPRLNETRKASNWDKSTPSKEYFNHLFRVSKNQVIWGGNYFNLGLTKHCIIWDKQQPEDLSFGMFDFAWTSFSKSNKIFRYSIQNEKNKIHHTQKPIQLYKWLLKNYAKEGDLILDTHVGSASSLIAFIQEGFDFIGYEIDKDYYDAATKRIIEVTSQSTIFDFIK